MAKNNDLLDKVGKLVEQILSNKIGLEELTIKKTQVEIALDYIKTKDKISEDNEVNEFYNLTENKEETKDE